MREIKFRAWDTIVGQMFDNVQQSSEFERFCFTPYKVMQYTGLKDKNGKEIYEGDVIREVSGEQYPHAFRETKTVEYGPMENCFDCTEDAGIGFNFGRLQDREVEVIGNIYENPELLAN